MANKKKPVFYATNNLNFNANVNKGREKKEHQFAVAARHGAIWKTGMRPTGRHSVMSVINHNNHVTIRARCFVL